MDSPFFGKGFFIFFDFFLYKPVFSFCLLKRRPLKIDFKAIIFLAME